MDFSKIKTITLLALTLASASSIAAAKVEEGYFVLDPDHKIMAELKQHKELTLDHVSAEGFEVYGPRGTAEKLNQMHIAYLSLADLELDIQVHALDYPRYPAVVARLQAIQSECSSIMSLFSVGKTVQGRDLWVMKVSSDPTVDQQKPEVKYISSMHGDEITGRQLMLNFLDDICKNYGKDAKVTRFVDQFEIFIMPSMNPDGSEMRRRANANGYDLNRDFPDFSSDNHNTPEGRQPETQAIMRFQAERNFVLSANFHGGAEVVNYPWDTAEERHPQDQMYQDIARVYASRVPYINRSPYFKNGITNGFDWYEVDGGMQDWSIHWYGDTQLTIELSDSKWPRFTEIPRFWAENHSALYAFLSLATQGAGFVLNSSETGEVRVVQVDEQGAELLDLGSFAFRHGEYYKILSPGFYRFEPKVDGRMEQPQSFVAEVKKAAENAESFYKVLE